MTGCGRLTVTRPLIAGTGYFWATPVGVGTDELCPTPFSYASALAQSVRTWANNAGSCPCMEWPIWGNDWYAAKVARWP